MRIIAFLILLAGVPAHADNGVPWRISYQGVLQQNGNSVNGSRQMEFRLFASASGGSALWTSNAMTVSVVNGAFTALLGTTDNPISTGTVAGGVLYLQVTVDGATLSPREEITSAAFALKAGSIDGIKIDSSGNVGIGVAAPASRLDIGAGALQLGSMTPPGQPLQGSAIIYANSNTLGCGSGQTNTQLFAKFSNNADILIAETGCVDPP